MPQELKDLQPARLLWALYQNGGRRFAFRASEAVEARRWQKRTRAALAQQIGLDRLPTSTLKAHGLEATDKGDYVREKFMLRTGPHSLMPVYLLESKSAPGPLPVVLAFHGHGYGVKDIVGLREDGSERDTPEGYHKDFAVALVRAGFAVAAPEIACFGERQTDFSYLDKALEQPVPTTCAHSAMLAFHQGFSVVGLRVRDGMRLIDYLQTRKDLDASRLGAMGISGGGMLTFFLTCLDERIRACVVSGYFSTFEDSILAMSHCACNFVPGLADFGEMYDLAGLIAPRPMLVEAGDKDPLFPIQAVRKSVARARRVFGIFGAHKAIATDYFEGPHEISGRKAYSFLRTALHSG
jgi:dienelactone hydrolase